jgi:hypothetical protein
MTYIEKADIINNYKYRDHFGNPIFKGDMIAYLKKGKFISAHVIELSEIEYYGTKRPILILMSLDGKQFNRKRLDTCICMPKSSLERHLKYFENIK